MLHILGILTWFMTLSAADLQWNKMTEAVSTQTGKHIKKKQVRQLSIKERSNILKSNPVTLADTFQYRVECLFSEYLHSEYQPVGEITNYVIKMEFQECGSQHAHCLLWVKNAPHADVDDDEIVCNFIDRYVLGLIPEDTLVDKNIAQLVRQYETHAHCQYCCRSHSCRFSYQKAPFPYIDM